MRMQQSSTPQMGAKRLRQQQLQREGSSSDRGAGDKRQQRFGPCPVCNRSIPLFRLEDHVNSCLDQSPPCPPTSRSSSVTTGNLFHDSSAVELFPATAKQGVDDVRCSGLENDPPVRQQDAQALSMERDLILGVDLKQPSNEIAFYDSKGKSVPCSGLQSPTLSKQQDACCLPSEGCLSLENSFSHSELELVHCSRLSSSTLDRQHNADCLRTERHLLGECDLLEPHNEIGADEEQEGFFHVKEDWGNIQRSGKLEYSGSKNMDCGTDVLLGENPWNGDLQDGGRDEQEMDRPPPGFKLFQRQVQSQARLSMFRNFSSGPLERQPSFAVLQSGMVLFRNWLDLETQQKFVLESQGVSHLFRRPSTSGGGKYHVYSMSWGAQYDTKSHRYAAKSPGRPIPSWMFELAQKLARDAQEHTSVYPKDSTYAPDVGLVNFYPVKAVELGVIGLGGHQDLDDSSSMPVVSVSIGDSMTFFYRRLPPFSRRKSGVSISVDEEAARSCKDGDAAHNREHQILLESGDVLVFGGKSRLVYHGTRHVQAGTRPPGLHIVPGRLNFTFRQTNAKDN